MCSIVESYSYVMPLVANVYIDVMKYSVCGDVIGDQHTLHGDSL
jgi:hypothetical protein